MPASWVRVSLALAVLGPAAARAADRERLRALARPPVPAYELNLVYDDRLGCALPGDPSAGAAEAATIRAALRGSADDADRHFRLGELYEGLARGEQAQAETQWHVRTWGPPYRDQGYHRARAKDFRRLARDAFARAAELYRLQLQQRPDDFALLLRRGQATDAAGRHADAEGLLRQVADRAPDDWRGWVALGRCLQGQYADAVEKADRVEGTSDPLHKAGWKLMGRRPAEALYAQARPYRDEARSCYDRAVQCAPDRPEPYLHRAEFLLAVTLRDGAATDTPLRDTARLIARAAPDFLEDVRRGVAHDPANVRLLVGAALLEVLTATDWDKVEGAASPASSVRLLAAGIPFLHKPAVPLGAIDLWAPLPAPARARVAEAVRRLEEITGSADAAQAAAAWEALALLRLLVQADAGQAREALHRAAVLQPARAATWDMLSACDHESQRFNEALVAGAERVRLQDSPQARLALAATYCRTGLLDRADEQVRAALVLQPEDAAANLFRAALLLKRPDDPAALKEAGACLDRAKRSLGDQSPAELHHDYALTRAIYHALAGEPWLAEQEWKRASAYAVDPGRDREVRQALHAR
jgi:Flp pilus assembly protein TadD